MNAEDLHLLLSRHFEIKKMLWGLEIEMSDIETIISKADVSEVHFDGISYPHRPTVAGGTMKRIIFIDNMPVIKYRVGEDCDLGTSGYPRILDDNYKPIEDEI